MGLSFWNRLRERVYGAAAGGQRRPPRAFARPGIEALEGRLVPTVSSSLVGGQLQVIGENAGNRIKGDHVAGKTVVNGASFLDGQITNGILIKSGLGIDSVTILRTVKPVTIDGQNGLYKVF